MKSRIKFLLTLSILSSAWIMSSAQASVIWSEDFTGIADGAASDTATSTGAGFIDYTGTVDIVSEAAVITPDGGSDRIEFETDPLANCVAGFFEFDLSVDNGTVTTPSLFIQMVDGDGRSTNGTPLPNFSDNVTSNNFNLSTTPSTVRWYFNTSGSPLVYTAPDGSMVTLASGTYDAWSGTTSAGSAQNASGQGGGLPSNVDTIVLQTFNSATGSVWTVDNASLTHLPVPEPASLGFVGLLLTGLFLLRTRR